VIKKFLSWQARGIKSTDCKGAGGKQSFSLMLSQAVPSLKGCALFAT
jgi:hypothetical protein